MHVIRATCYLPKMLQTYTGEKRPSSNDAGSTGCPHADEGIKTCLSACIELIPNGLKMLV